MRARTLIVFAMAVGVMVIAGTAFIHKMIEFTITMSGDEVAGFGAVAVAIYLFGMLPLLFLTLWAVFTGRLRDIEGPAQRMLDLNRELDEEGCNG